MILKEYRRNNTLFFAHTDSDCIKSVVILNQIIIVKNEITRNRSFCI